MLKSYQGFLTSVLYKYTAKAEQTLLNALTLVMPLASPSAFWEQNYCLQVWCAEGRSLGLMVVQFLDLSQHPSALLANKIPIRRKNQML